MTHDRLFAYYMKHKKPYDSSNRPDYAARRSFIDVPVPQGLSLTETSRCSVPGELIYDFGSTHSKVVLFIHGGSFTSCDKGTVRSACFYIARKCGVDVYSTNYALAPEHPFPQGLDDVYNVYLDLCSDYGASNIVIMGESAGACLALGLCNRAFAAGKDLPCALVLLSPPVQAMKVLDSHIRNLDTDCMVSNFLEESWAEYFQTTDPTVLSSPEASPIFGDFSSFPPTLVFCSDTEVLYDDSIMLEEAMRTQGSSCTLVVEHALMHVYPLYINLPEGRAAMDRAVAFISERLV